MLKTIGALVAGVAMMFASDVNAQRIITPIVQPGGGSIIVRQNGRQHIIIVNRPIRGRALCQPRRIAHPRLRRWNRAARIGGLHRCDRYHRNYHRIVRQQNREARRVYRQLRRLPYHRRPQIIYRHQGRYNPVIGVRRYRYRCR